MITDEVNGLLVPAKDDAAIARSVLRLQRDPSLRTSLAARAQAQANGYSWESVARRVLAYYERLLYERRQVAEAKTPTPDPEPELARA